MRQRWLELPLHRRHRLPPMARVIRAMRSSMG
jgi:hypothetical protein